MRVKLGLVAENTEAYINQVKLLLFSLRKNGGVLKDVPVVLITNNEPLEHTTRTFLEQNFGPIECKTMPRLGGTPHTSKYNIFYGIDPDTYDVLLFMDCDTVVLGPLDDMLKPIKGGAEFVCRRGGKTDRNNFVNFSALVKRYGKGHREIKVYFEGEKEYPMFNSGVFLATPDTVRDIRYYAVEYAYDLYDRWLRVSLKENIPLIRYLYQYEILSSKKDVFEAWTIDQGALALACIQSGVKVEYLKEEYNSWGNLCNLKILHCFKSAYSFNRETMFLNEDNDWLQEYKESDVIGKRKLAQVVEEYKSVYMS